MVVLGTVGLYEEMAQLLNSDEQWQQIGKRISCTMVHEYLDGSGSAAFFMQFEEGRVCEVRQLDSIDANSVDFVISGPSEAWQRVIQKELDPKMALLKGDFKLKGSLSFLLKNMKSFSYIIDSMSRLELA